MSQALAILRDNARSDSLIYAAEASRLLDPVLSAIYLRSARRRQALAEVLEAQLQLSATGTRGLVVPSQAASCVVTPGLSQDGPGVCGATNGPAETV